jgi:hypothetical protein
MAYQKITQRVTRSKVNNPYSRTAARLDQNAILVRGGAGKKRTGGREYSGRCAAVRVEISHGKIPALLIILDSITLALLFETVGDSLLVDAGPRSIR